MQSKEARPRDEILGVGVVCPSRQLVHSGVRVRAILSVGAHMVLEVANDAEGEGDTVMAARDPCGR